jgi:hypothetical protein
MVFFPLKRINSVEKVNHSCCKIQDTDSKSNKSNDDCCNNGCNPFFNCCGMMGFVPVEKKIEQAFDLMVIYDNIDFYIPMISSYGDNIWQPPKI